MMDRGGSFRRFDLNYDCVFHHQIHFVRAFQFETLIGDRQMYLPVKLKSQLPQFVTQTFFVNRFQQPGPQMAMNFDGRANDLFSQDVLQRRRAPRR